MYGILTKGRKSYKAESQKPTLPIEKAENVVNIYIRQNDQRYEWPNGRKSKRPNNVKAENLKSRTFTGSKIKTVE